MALQINLLDKLKDWFYTETEVDTALEGKVDKVTGKGLSTNDFTTEEKTKLANLENTTVDSELSNSSTNPVQNNIVKGALDTKVDKVNGKGLSTEDYTTAEKTKLANIEAEANKTIVDSALSDSSTNPVQNSVVKSALDGKAAFSHTQSTDTILLANNDTLTSKLSTIDSTITDIINNKMALAIVAQLPATGNVNTIYAVPNENESGDNVYTEYWWNSTTSEFEEMGDRTIDLSDYVQKSDVSISLSNEGILSITC